MSANATSPASDQLAPESYLDFGSWAPQDCQIWDYPAFLCPRVPFLLIIQVNYLRLRQANGHDVHADAEAVLHEICDFSAYSWTIATRRGHFSIWLAISQIYKLSVKVYALSTICRPDPSTSAAAVDPTGQIAEGRAEILRLMQELPHSILTRYCLVWSAVVAGVYATAEEQQTVRSILTDISKSCGMVSPLLAIKVLEAFWRSNDQSWDACFDKPYAFLA